MNTTPAVLLVLVTGIPAAGKSAFLAAVKAHAGGCGADARATPLFDGDCVGYVADVLHMDVVLASLEVAQASTIADADESRFTPARWKEATRRLLAQTATALRECLGDAGGAGAVDTTRQRRVPLLFVEDNMHYRSMRERYYRLCRTVEAEASATRPHPSCAPPFIALVEARFATPLALCLERNATRGRACDGSGSAWVPPPVITLMDALFDHGYTASAEAAGEATGGTAGLWNWTASSLPWGLLVLQTVSPPSRFPTPAETAADFLDVALQQPAASTTCQRQYVDAVRVRMARQQRAEAELGEEDRSRRAAEAATTRIHLLDLQLRAVTHAFLSQRQQREASTLAALQNTALLRKRISSAKQDAMTRFKAELRQAGLGDSDDGNADEAQEGTVHAFQQILLDLWQSHGSREDNGDTSFPQ